MHQRLAVTCSGMLRHADEADAMRHARQVSIVWEQHLLHLDAETRPLLVVDYVEELTSIIVGASYVLPFLTRCFRRQPFFFTKPKSEEHLRLWDTRRGREGEDEP